MFPSGVSNSKKLFDLFHTERKNIEFKLFKAIEAYIIYTLVSHNSFNLFVFIHF